MKIIFGVVSGFVLIVLFLVVYSIAMNLKPREVQLSGFSNQPATVGKAGGFHLLSDIQVLSRDKYDTVAIYTKLNRTSTIEDIITPYAEMTAEGTTGVRIKLADTAVQTELPKAIWERLAHQSFDKGIIRDVALFNPRDLDTQEVVIQFAKPTRYRLSVDPQDSGVIYLDVLK